MSLVMADTGILRFEFWDLKYNEATKALLKGIAT